MKQANCFSAGLRRVVQKPTLIFWMYLSLVLVAFPLTAVMRFVLRDAMYGNDI